MPVPDETLLTLSGYLAYSGRFALLPTIAVAFAGSATGMSVSYAAGRGPGLRVLRRLGPRLHLDAARLARAQSWFGRLGKWLIVVGYFVPGVRHLTALCAGAAQMPVRTFLPLALAGALTWSATFVLIGYGFGEEWLEGWRMLQHHRSNVLLVLAVAGAGWLVVRRVRRAYV